MNRIRLSLPLSTSRWLSLAVALLACASLHAQETAPAQDQVVLKNGSRIIGKVVESRDGVLTLETDFAGTISVQMEQVASVDSAEPVVLLLADESVHHDSSLRIEEEQLALKDVGQAVPLEELRVINPLPWELGQGYHWTGSFGVTFEKERGNTDTDEMDLDAESVWRSTEDRYTLKWSSEQDKKDNDKTKDTWRVTGKYDYFLTDPNYVGLLALAESDKFEDLDLRYLVGPYYGRQFFTQPVFSLSGELGVSYVNEEFDEAEDQDYPASMWSAHASSNILGGDSRLYFDQFGVWNLDDTSDVIVNTTFGLAFPPLWNLEAAAEVLLEYDSGAVDNVDDLDQTYKFRISYLWD